MYRNLWFEGRDSRRQLPPECVADCSGSGDRAADVRAWVRRLDFDGPGWWFSEARTQSGRVLATRTLSSEYAADLFSRYGSEAEITYFS